MEGLPALTRPRQRSCTHPTVGPWVADFDSLPHFLQDGRSHFGDTEASLYLTNNCIQRTQSPTVVKILVFRCASVLLMHLIPHSIAVVFSPHLHSFLSATEFMAQLHNQAPGLSCPASTCKSSLHPCKLHLSIAPQSTVCASQTVYSDRVLLSPASGHEERCQQTSPPTQPCLFLRHPELSGLFPQPVMMACIIQQKPG